MTDGHKNRAERRREERQKRRKAAEWEADPLYLRWLSLDEYEAPQDSSLTPVRGCEIMTPDGPIRSWLTRNIDGTSVIDLDAVTPEQAKRILAIYVEAGWLTPQHGRNTKSPL